MIMDVQRSRIFKDQVCIVKRSWRIKDQGGSKIKDDQRSRMFKDQGWPEIKDDQRSRMTKDQGWPSSRMNKDQRSLLFKDFHCSKVTPDEESIYKSKIFLMNAKVTLDQGKLIKIKNCFPRLPRILFFGKWIKSKECTCSIVRKLNMTKHKVGIRKRKVKDTHAFIWMYIPSSNNSVLTTSILPSIVSHLNWSMIGTS